MPGCWLTSEMGGDETKWSDEELYRTHGEMTKVEVKHDQRVHRIRARLVAQCRVVLYYSTGVSSGTVGNTGHSSFCDCL